MLTPSSSSSRPSFQPRTFGPTMPAEGVRSASTRRARRASGSGAQSSWSSHSHSTTGPSASDEGRPGAPASAVDRVGHRRTEAGVPRHRAARWPHPRPRRGPATWRPWTRCRRRPRGAAAGRGRRGRRGRTAASGRRRGRRAPPSRRGGSAGPRDGPPRPPARPRRRAPRRPRSPTARWHRSSPPPGGIECAVIGGGRHGAITLRDGPGRSGPNPACRTAPGRCRRDDARSRRRPS